MNKGKLLRIIFTAVLIAALAAAAVGCGRKAADTKGSEQTSEVVTAEATQTAGTETADGAEAVATTEATAGSEAAATTEETTEATTAEQGPVYYTWDDIEDLENTEHFSSSAIEHIFNGSVNSSGNGSGYHYDMVEGSDGQIIPGTRSEEDINGLYTANVEVDGHRKNHYSTFFPDEWSPQEVVDAINAARQDALDNDRHQGTTWIGYFEDIEIDMYFDSKDRIVSAFPVYEDDRH